MEYFEQQFEGFEGMALSTLQGSLVLDDKGLYSLVCPRTTAIKLLTAWGRS